MATSKFRAIALATGMRIVELRDNEKLPEVWAAIGDGAAILRDTEISPTVAIPMLAAGNSADRFWSHQLGAMIGTDEETTVTQWWILRVVDEDGSLSVAHWCGDDSRQGLLWESVTSVDEWRDTEWAESLCGRIDYDEWEDLDRWVEDALHG